MLIINPYINDPVRKKAGFTLIELSIVLVIIALLVSAVTVGAGVLKNAENRALAKEFEEYKAAVYSFKTTYKGLPGDLWQRAIAEPLIRSALNMTTTNPISGQIFGDGDGRIEFCINAPDACVGTPSTREARYAWWTLSGAGMIPTIFRDVDHGQQTRIETGVIGIDYPPSKAIIGAGFFFDHGNFNVSVSNRNYIAVGMAKAQGMGNIRNDLSALDSDDARAIDMKYDDGNPAAGYVWGDNGYDLHATPGDKIGRGALTDPNVRCINANDYDLNNRDRKTCILAFTF